MRTGAAYAVLVAGLMAVTAGPGEVLIPMFAPGKPAVESFAAVLITPVPEPGEPPMY